MGKKSIKKRILEAIRLIDNQAKAMYPVSDEIDDASVVGEVIDERLENLLTYGRLLNKVNRAKKIADKIVPRAESKAVPGSGALSESKIWGIRGWRLTPHGFVWSRPPSVRLKEHTPPTATKYISDYSNIDAEPPTTNYPLVTSEQAKEMREDRAAVSRSLLQNWRRLAEDKRTRMGEGELFIHDKKRKVGRKRAEELWQEKEAAELRKRESRISIASRAAQLNAYKQFPWMKSLVDAGVVQKKELPKMAKTLLRMSKTPIFGRFVKHPMLIPLAAAAAGIQMMKAADESNRGYVGWENAFNFFGRPSRSFISTAYKAGIEDPGKIAEMYGKLKLKYLDPEKFLSMIGGRLAGMGETERLFTANALGLSPGLLAMADLYSGRMKPSKARLVAAGVSMAKTAQELGLRTGSGTAETIGALQLLIPGAKGIVGRHAAISPGYERVLEDTIIRQLPKAQEAARSAEIYEGASSKWPRQEPSGSEAPGNKISFNINSISVNANNYEEFIQSVAAESETRYSIDVMNWADSRRIKA